jgi:hypothetical protein
MNKEGVCGSGCIDHIFLTSTGGEWSASLPGRLIAGERAPGTHYIGGWVDPRAGLDDKEKRRRFLTLLGHELRLLGRPARSQSLYRLSYPGSLKSKYNEFKIMSMRWKHLEIIRKAVNTFKSRRAQLILLKWS